MGQRRKALFLFSLMAVVVYTFCGISEVDGGGPCNAGLALIFLNFTLFICVVLVASTYHWLKPSGKPDFIAPVVILLLPLAIWSYCLFSFAADNLKDAFRNLGVFELFIILLLIFFVQQFFKSRRSNT